MHGLVVTTSHVNLRFWKMNMIMMLSFQNLSLFTVSRCTGPISVLANLLWLFHVPITLDLIKDTILLKLWTSALLTGSVYIWHNLAFLLSGHCLVLYIKRHPSSTHLKRIIVLVTAQGAVFFTLGKIQLWLFSFLLRRFGSSPVSFLPLVWNKQLTIITLWWFGIQLLICC